MRLYPTSWLKSCTELGDTLKRTSQTYSHTNKKENSSGVLSGIHLNIALTQEIPVGRQGIPIQNTHTPRHTSKTNQRIKAKIVFVSMLTTFMIVLHVWYLLIIRMCRLHAEEYYTGYSVTWRVCVALWRWLWQWPLESSCAARKASNHVITRTSKPTTMMLVWQCYTIH